MGGMTSRAPQFERVPGPTPLIITPRDERILRHVRRHRFLNSEQILRLIGGSRAAVLRRLHLLFHHGYLDRPKAQIRHFEPKLNRPLVYALAKKGTRHLYDLGEVESLRIHEKRVGEIYLDHTLLVSEFMSRLEAELPSGVKLEYLDDGESFQRQVSTCSWTVPIHYRGTPLDIGVIPDRAFRLTTRDDTMIFCLEVDRGTMPVMRSNPSQSSFYRKLLAYHETWRSGLHHREMDWRRFRVLTLTSSKERHDHLVSVCREVVSSGGSGLFMFTDKQSFRDAENILGMPWTLGSGLFPAKILSETRS
jgi:hypothetical protein